MSFRRTCGFFFLRVNAIGSAISNLDFDHDLISDAAIRIFWPHGAVANARERLPQGYGWRKDEVAACAADAGCASYCRQTTSLAAWVRQLM
jgi:hypothetical protein